MIAFGAAFGYTVMARMSLLIGRLTDLIEFHRSLLRPSEPLALGFDLGGDGTAHQQQAAKARRLSLLERSGTIGSVLCVAERNLPDRRDRPEKRTDQFSGCGCNPSVNNVLINKSHDYNTHERSQAVSGPSNFSVY